VERCLDSRISYKCTGGEFSALLTYLSSALRNMYRSSVSHNLCYILSFTELESGPSVIPKTNVAPPFLNECELIISIFQSIRLSSSSDNTDKTFLNQFANYESAVSAGKTSKETELIDSSEQIFISRAKIGQITESSGFA
jgi:hypothetical protein